MAAPGHRGGTVVHVDRAALLAAAEARGRSDDAVADWANGLAAALRAAPSPEIALVDAFAACMESIGEAYFGIPWPADHACSLYARLTDDPRAWGYGSEEEIAPLSWLVEATGLWFDGRRLCERADWAARFDDWADGQAAIVRRMTPPPPPDTSA